MIHRVRSVFSWIVLASAMCVGQSSFQGLTPGASTRHDVERKLGKPVNSISGGGTTIADYTPSAGIQKVEVGYRQNSEVVGQIYVYLDKPVSRRALIQKLGLPQQADFQGKGENGLFHELFGGEALLTLVYESADADSGVKLIVYNSKEAFDFILKKFRAGT